MEDDVVFAKNKMEEEDVWLDAVTASLTGGANVSEALKNAQTVTIQWKILYEQLDDDESEWNVH